VLESLTGLGLATSAGLNAYIPLLTIGLLARFTDLITPPDDWRWLSNPWVLIILGGLLLVEMVADKVPTVDHLNDVIQTVVRPTAGGLAFGAASSSQTVTVDDPAAFFGGHQWVPIATGVIIALCVHTMKATARPVINATTFGIGAPVMSLAEDVASVTVSAAAIVLPVLVLVLIAMNFVFFWWARRRLRRGWAAKRLARAQSSALGQYQAPGPDQR
jgi:hypothetical protein